MEWLCESTHCLIRVLPIKKVYLLKCSTVCLDTAEASHFYNHRSDTFQLVFTRLEFSGRLEHITIYKAELNFTFLHNRYIIVRGQSYSFIFTPKGYKTDKLHKKYVRLP